MSLLLGVDGGGTKTMAVLADNSGNVVGIGLGGTGNFQVSSQEQARVEVKASIVSALRMAGAKTEDVAGAYFGMAGADRPRDFEIVHELLEPVVPFKARWNFENDALLGLWAGTLDGVGVGVVCGTGTNVVGVNKEGKKVQVGGMGALFGDYAGGSYIGELAVARGMRGHEGRGQATALYEKLCAHYDVTELLDLVDFIYEGKDLGLSSLVPLVIDVASEGDMVAQEILKEVGHELGVSALAAVRHLFTHKERVKVVGIGSVFQRSRLPLMYNEFVDVLQKSQFNVEPTILQCEPVAGAIFGAAAQIGLTVTEDFKNKVQTSLAAALQD